MHTPQLRQQAPRCIPHLHVTVRQRLLHPQPVPLDQCAPPPPLVCAILSVPAAVKMMQVTFALCVIAAVLLTGASAQEVSELQNCAGQHECASRSDDCQALLISAHARHDDVFFVWTRVTAAPPRPLLQGDYNLPSASVTMEVPRSTSSARRGAVPSSTCELVLPARRQRRGCQLWKPTK